MHIYDWVNEDDQWEHECKHEQVARVISGNLTQADLVKGQSYFFIGISSMTYLQGFSIGLKSQTKSSKFHQDGHQGCHNPRVSVKKTI